VAELFGEGGHMMTAGLWESRIRPVTPEEER
jgi:hypothetical protein